MEKLRTGYQKTMMVAGSLMSWIRLSLSDNDTDYTSIRISKAIFILSVPMVLEMFMSSVFSLADMYFVSRLGSDAIATVGLTEAVVNLVYAIAFGISIATTALVSRRIGERKYRAASETALQAVLLGFIISVLIAIPGFLFTRDLLRLMGASSTMIYEMSGYMKIVLAGNFSIILIFINNAIFRSAGKPLIALKTLAVANALNIVLDPLLIFGWGPVPAMGIEGAAWATLMGRGLAVVYQLYLLNRPTGKLRFSLARRFFDRQTMFRIVTLAWSAISQNLSATISWLLLVRIISSFGSIAVAGYTIALRLLLFLLLPVAGIANATSTLVGQNLGANKTARVVLVVKITAVASALIMLMLGFFSYVLSDWAVSLFTDHPATREAAAKGLRMLALGFPLYGLGMVMINAINGAGDTRTPFYINLLCYVFFQISLAWLLSYTFGFESQGVYVSILAAEALFTLAGILFFVRGKWKTINI